MTFSLRTALVAAALALAAGCSAPRGDPATSSVDPERGRLLYDTACGACHTTQAHWRDKRIVRSWPDLIHQVSRWQGAAGQSWSDAEIEDVASYLNDRFYRLPCPRAGCGKPVS